jgi:glutamyl/glutaminyl-tRNA synthetase
MTREALAKAGGILSDLNDIEWSKKEILEKILLEAAGEKKGDLLWPLRLALTGAERSPSPFEVAWVLGKKESLKRLQNAVLLLS